MDQDDDLYIVAGVCCYNNSRLVRHHLVLAQICRAELPPVNFAHRLPLGQERFNDVGDTPTGKAVAHQVTHRDVVDIGFDKTDLSLHDRRIVLARRITTTNKAMKMNPCGFDCSGCGPPAATTPGVNVVACACSAILSRKDVR